MLILAAILGTEGIQIGSNVFGGSSSDVGEMGERIKHLDELHNRFDQDGIPLWYFPRGFAVTQSAVLEELREIRKVLEAQDREK